MRGRARGRSAGEGEASTTAAAETSKRPLGSGRQKLDAVNVDFYTVAKWHDGQIVEENLMYDLVTFLKQIGQSD